MADSSFDFTVRHPGELIIKVNSFKSADDTASIAVQDGTAEILGIKLGCGDEIQLMPSTRVGNLRVLFK